MAVSVCYLSIKLIVYLSHFFISLSVLFWIIRLSYYLFIYVFFFYYIILHSIIFCILFMMSALFSLFILFVCLICHILPILFYFVCFTHVIFIYRFCFMSYFTQMTVIPFTVCLYVSYYFLQCLGVSTCLYVFQVCISQFLAQLSVR